jgi:NhaP-type Na+/H+ or K+/H+ antiporter
VLVDVIWRLAAGTAVGWAAGWALGYFAFRLPGSSTLARTGDGFVALGITALTYGVAELVEGYGFIAVFVAAVVLRDAERDHEYHTELHDFTEQIERLLMMVLLVCFGAAIAEGSVFDAISWPVVGVTL